MSDSADFARVLRIYRWVLGLFIVSLVLSGLTAFPLLWELDMVSGWLGPGTGSLDLPQVGLEPWIVTVRDGLRDTYTKYPWVAYGTDWLAFAHVVLAVFFIGPFLDPVRNVWVLKAGLVACVLVVPLALICGQLRGIPLGWRLIDCSFGLGGAIPLLYCLKLTQRAARISGSVTTVGPTQRPPAP